MHNFHGSVVYIYVYVYVYVFTIVGLALMLVLWSQENLANNVLLKSVLTFFCVGLSIVPIFGDQTSWNPNCRENIQSHSLRRKRRAWMRKTKMSMGRPCVARVGRITLQMNSGYAATYVRSGSTASV